MIRAFLSAPIDADTSIVRELLAERGVNVIDSRDFRPGMSVHAAIRQAISSSDFVLGVIDDRTTTVVFEAGVAVGQGKDLALICPPPHSPPFDLALFATCRASLSDRDAIGRFLDSLVLLRGRSWQSAPPPQIRSTELLRSLTLPPPHVVSARNLESSVSTLLSNLSSVVEQGPGEENRRADFAIWIDELQPVFGNPILVECKWSERGPEPIERAQVALLSHLLQASGRLGVVVHNLDFPRLPGISIASGPAVLAMSYNDLREAIATGQFVSQLLRLRQRAVLSREPN